MLYKIYRHPEVEQDLNDIVDLITEYAGVAIAEHKLTEIEASINKLAQTPHTGSIRGHIFPGLRSIPTARKGVITFTVDDEKKSVFIVSITYAGANWISRTSHRAVLKN